MDHDWTDYATSAHHDEHHGEIERLKHRLAEQDARGLQLAAEVERLERQTEAPCVRVFVDGDA